VSNSENEQKHKYAERLFPAPVDHGVAREDRAVSTVVSGVDTAELVARRALVRGRRTCR